MWLVSVLGRLWIGNIAIGLAVAGAAVPASFAQSARVLSGKPGTVGIEADERKTPDVLPEGPTPTEQKRAGVSVAVPIGRISVGPEFVVGEPVYVRRTAAHEGMMIVEVSATPLEPVLGASEDHTGGRKLTGRPDEQPASW
jgi:hypothetical protein